MYIRLKYAWYRNEIWRREKLGLTEGLDALAAERDCWYAQLDEMWRHEASAIFMDSRYEAQLQEALAGFDVEWSRFNVHPLNEIMVAEADKLLRQKAGTYGLRALDALQFASFRLMAEQDWAFVVADGLLADAIVSDGFAVIKVALPSP